MHSGKQAFPTRFSSSISRIRQISSESGDSKGLYGSKARLIEEQPFHEPLQATMRLWKLCRADRTFPWSHRSWLTGIDKPRGHFWSSKYTLHTPVHSRRSCVKTTHIPCRACLPQEHRSKTCGKVLQASSSRMHIQALCQLVWRGHASHSRLSVKTP